jgi:hypothetical protein
MFKFNEDLMAERLSVRCHNPVPGIGGIWLPRGIVKTENGLGGPVRIVQWISHCMI